MMEEQKEPQWQEERSGKDWKRLEHLGVRILQTSRNELYLKMRFLDVALSSLMYEMDPTIYGMGTDGFGLFFESVGLGRLYQADPVMINRLYLHQVLHCIFRHLTGRKGREERLYHLACDIAVESILDSLRYKVVLKSRSFLRRETYRKLQQEYPVLTAERIYRCLDNWKMTEAEVGKLEMEFRRDDHSRWPEEDKKKQNEIENRWQNIREQMETDMETFSKDAAEESGHLMEQVKVENRLRYDYRQFLRKFSVLREEMKIDDDAFDYTFYCYGLSVYGNMPLIEPQEWKETQKVEEFVIVIDTSMSCSGDLVRKFLEETYGVLSENESFFCKVNIHIVQCDDQVQSDQRITNEEELKEYMEQLKLCGEGGTDFRPAFAYVDQLIGEHAFQQLKGLLYFTDGKGIYPAKMPPYETAFVFLKEDYEDVDVPPWAMKLILEEEDLRTEERM